MHDSQSPRHRHHFATKQGSQHRPGWQDILLLEECRINHPKRGYKDGKLIPGSGGDLCDQANTLHLLVLESPLTVTELHFHSDVLTLDEELGVPFSSGTSVEYNNVDYRFVNDTGQDFQLLSWCEGEMHYAQLRCEHEIPYYYRLVEEDHHFAKEKDKYYRISKIYRETYDKANGSLIKKGLIRDNHSEVMFAPSLIPPSLLRQ